ncbi:MAG: ABC transporter permease subunit [Candidatus Bathyarchaeia archaeon]
MASVSVIASKEFSDIIGSKRFIILLSIFALLMIAAVASTYISATQGIAAPTAMPRGFLLSVASNLTSMMTYFAPILGIVLGVDAVSGEREKGTLKMVLAQPVFRDTYAVAYYGIAILISTVSKRTTVSVIASIMIWAVFTFILPIIVTMVAFSVTPIRI